MTRPMNIVILGLSISSSWGNGHATTYRSLIAGLRQEGHHVLFLERDVPWYAENRDLPAPPYCDLAYYDGPDELTSRYGDAIRSADAVVVGSYVPDGAQVIDRVRAMGTRLLAFYDIDTPVTLAALESGERAYLTPDQIPLFDIYFSFSGGRALDRLRDRFDARNPIPLYCSVDPGRYAPTGEPPEWDLGYLGTFSPDRQPTLDRFLLEPARQLPGRRFVVAGSRYPDEIAWPRNVDRIEHLPPGEHASFYSRQRFTLNVTRADMIALGWSPSVRLFEAAACAAPVISDGWDGLSSFFPQDEAIVVARTTDDVVRALTEMPEARRKAMAEAARARIAPHTGRARARELVAHLRHAARNGEFRETERRSRSKETAP